MPLFYFHLLGNDPNIYDDIGLDLADADAARHVASETARAIIEEAKQAGRPIGKSYIEICDEKNDVVDVVSLRSVAKPV